DRRLCVGGDGVCGHATTLGAAGLGLQSNSVRGNQSTSAAAMIVPAGYGPAHQRLAEGIRAAIRGGRLRPGDTLPASRNMAAHLGISRWVVTEAYQQLAAEGYLAARAGSATRVAAAATRSAHRSSLHEDASSDALPAAAI